MLSYSRCFDRRNKLGGTFHRATLAKRRIGSSAGDVNRNAAPLRNICRFHLDPLTLAAVADHGQASTKWSAIEKRAATSRLKLAHATF